MILNLDFHDISPKFPRDQPGFHLPSAPVAAWWSKQEKMLSAERRQQEQLGFHRAFDQTWSSRGEAEPVERKMSSRWGLGRNKNRDLI